LAICEESGDTIRVSLISWPTASLGLEGTAVNPTVAGSPDTPLKASARPGRSTADGATILPDSPVRCFHHFAAERDEGSKTGQRAGRENFSLAIGLKFG